ncbi:putative uncharacterized protein DDB_G0282133 isoform X5 [Apis mellifera]|uniref:Afadin n=1 Tax=Apis mellifera TaxID=7460 RepID=A0A7M7L5Z8_APIME|nr:putative uncharacterized protein DDB_G0282133 isoform X5 [Apis mellifera]|eukprot:XP_026295554.1 putative uncharacterized protein DDB_G0282133 isoform X5 [Apis mellifera]
MIAIKLVMATELANKKAEREALRGVIQQWNANRLDLFELSEPNEDLEFHGVMRFYFQDSGQKVATKCIRVASDATSQAVIETLIEKFRPDMRMLSVPEYALYEIHENGEERKLGLEEKPLLVQLNWHIDDREGRFLLRRIDDKTNAQGVGFSSSDGSSFRRKLSKREKKQMKKQEKLSRLKSLEQDENSIPVDQNGVAEKLYTELPETSFTRSISNPEAVMRRRRQQKLERKLQQFRSKDGGPDTGGTLKIYGEALCKDVPYKTLLLSVRDSAVQVVREMLSKYGLEKVDPQQYCLVQVNSENNLNGGTQQEYILDDDECPLAILMNHSSTRGSIMFHVRRRPSDYVPRKRKKKPSGKWNELDCRYEDERLPFLLELNPDGSEIPNGAGVRHRLQPNVTEVGSERPIGPQAVQAQTLTLTGPTVMPRHCVIAFTENIVTLTPCSRDAYTYVNNQRIHQTTILQNGAIVKFGRLHTFKFIDPTPDERIRQRHDSGKQIEYNYDRLLLYRRRSPDLANQETNMEKYGTVSGTSNNGQNQVQIQSQSIQDQIIHSSSPNKSTPIPAAAVTVCHTRSPTHALESTHNYETTFDLDGNVETASLTSSRDGNRTLQNDRQPRGTDPILPAVLEFLEETEETFFHAVITDVEPSAPQFKLAPTYTLYLAARYRASTHFRPELQPTERAHRLTVMLANVASMIQRVIQERYMDASSLALWLANGSELLHMLKNDRHVGAFSTRAQDILTEAVHTAFASLVRCISLELAPAMSQFMADADEPAKEAGVLQIFSSTMALLRRCRVNAALTIQLFSHLFHTINATTFNALVSNTNLCVRWFGRRLKARLNALETWAERQGLELASQCHLATIMQATHLLQAPKYNAEELATLSSTCFKLNSLQVRALLQKYQPAADEPRLPAELIENVVRVAESVADTLARADGREIRLEEEPTLALALLLPEDGYSCEVIRGVPPGLAEFLAPLQRDGLCRMASQPTSSGYWTIYMIDHHNNFRSPSAMSNRSGGYSCHAGSNIVQPEIHIIKLHKSTNGMGLSIVAAKGAGQDRLGIYIKSVVTGGAADADGRLTAGDQLLKVDGQSLVGITQEKAAEYLVRTGPIVTLEVAKQGAIYHGLATLLSQPSPVMNRAYKIRPKSESLEASTAQEMNEQSSTSHSMDSNSDSSATVNNKCNSFSLDSIPYIDQVDEISSVPFSSNQFQLELDKYQLENNNRVVIKRYDSQLINEEGQIANRYERGEASSYKQEKYTKTNKQANKYNMAKQQEKNDEIKERKVKDILLSPYVILNNNDDFEIFISKAKADMFNIPVLNLDLSGLDSNTTYDVSSFNKCWKSPEENMNIISSNNIILDKDMNKDMNKMLSSYNINEKLISENIQKYDSPYIINIAKNYIQRKNTKQKLSNAKFMKQLSSSYPNIERIKELWHNENNQLKEGNRKKYLWFNLKKCDSVYELKQINDILSLPTKQFQFWNDNNITNYEEKLCKQNFIVQDKCQQKSMSFIKENNYSNILPIQIKKNRKNNMINNQQIPILIEKIYTNNTINLMLDQDWKIYPRSNRTHLNLDFFLRSRRMSERDLPSRLGRDITAPQQQMHISKSVPALHNVGTDGKQQHEVFNPGYSRASSSNSVTPPVTQPPPPMATISGSTSLRSRSSHNLHDSTRIGTLSSNGLVTRQQSSPNLNPDHTSNHNDTNVNGGTNSNILQGNEVERFYQNLSIYRNQDATTKQHNPSQHLDDRTPLQLQKNLRGSQNSLNRPGVFEMNQTRDRPISSYVPQPQQQSYIDNTGQSQQQACTAPPRSQSSRDIIRQEAKLQEMQEEVRRRELRGGISVPLNQYRPSTYNLKTNTSVQSSISSVVRPTKSIGSQPNLGSSPPITISTSVSTSRQTGPSSYNYLDAQYGSYMVQYGKSSHTHQHQSQSQSQHQHSHQHQLQLQHQYQHQHQHQHQHHNIQQQNFGHIQYGHVGMLSSRGKNDLTRMQLNGTLHDYGRDQNIRDIGKLYTDQNQHVAGSQYCLNSNPEIQNEFYNDENGINRMQTAPEGTSISNEIPIRPILPEEGFTESSPPPPPSTSTHPLYNKQSDSRYTASMQDPPRGGYYPTNTTGTTLQPRQYQYSASNPWQREEKEREQARRREAARQWRDQQIAELSALSHRTSQQEEQLRALQLERDFQKRAEEIANQQDDDEESNDLDTENIRVQQSLFQTTVMQDRNNSLEQHSNLSKTNVTNQSSKGNHFSRSLGGSPMHSMNVVTTHGNNTLQQCTQNITTTCLQQQQQQQDNSSSLLSSDFQHQHTNQMQNNIGQISMPSLIHLTSSQKSLGLSQSNEEKEMHRRHEEIKRKQIDFDDTQLKKEEETNKQQQMYQQQHHSQQSQSHLKTQQLLHSNMLRLDSLIINGSNASPTQNGINDAPLPPERGSSFAVMSQQNTLRSNNANISNIILASQPQTTSVKRVSFHDSNANVESIRNISSGNLSTNQTMTMDAITEDPNNFINDAEILLASPKTPEGSGGTSITGSTPGVIGAQEVYKDPRQKRLAEKQKQQQSSQVGQVPEKLSFKEKMKMFAMETGEDGTPRDKVKISRAQREIDNIGNPVLNSNYYNNSNNSIINTSNSNIQNNNNGNSINNNNSNRQQ